MVESANSGTLPQPPFPSLSPSHSLPPPSSLPPSSLSPSSLSHSSLSPSSLSLPFLQPAWFLMVGGDWSFKLALTEKDEEFSNELREDSEVRGMERTGGEREGRDGKGEGDPCQ